MGKIVEGAVISIHITFSNDFIPFLQEFYKIEKLKTSKLKKKSRSLCVPLDEYSGKRLREYFLLRSPPIYSERNMLLLSLAIS